MNSQAGFTLVEVLVAMVVSLIIMGGAYTTFISHQKQTTAQTEVSDSQQTLRAAMDFMARDLRTAGYDPEMTGRFSVTDVQLDASGMSAISFTQDINENGTLDANETFRYTIADMPIGTPDGILDLAREIGASGRQLLAPNITTLGLAYAFDNDDDGELEEDAAGNIIWGVNNGGTWNSLIVNQLTGTANQVPTGVPVDTRTIRAVRIWMLAQTESDEPGLFDNNIYVVGPHVVQPNNNFRHRLMERIVLCRNTGLR